MKKTLAILLAVVMLLGMLPISAFAAEADPKPTLRFEHNVENVSALKVGDEFTVTAYLENNPGFAVFQFDLEWDNTVVQFDGYATYNNRGQELFDSYVFTPTEYNDANGKIVFGAATNVTYQPKEDEYMFVAKFTVLKEGDPDIGYVAADFQMKHLVSPGQFEVIDVTMDLSALAELTISHTHNYGEGVVTPPSCTVGGYTTYTCACGDSYKGAITSATGHTPSTTEAGKCATCGADITIIPSGAPFLDMMTSDGKPVTITDMGMDPQNGMFTLYKVEVPLGTTQVNITYNQGDVYVDQFGYAKTYHFGFDNVTEDGYGQTTKDGKTTVGLQMEKTPANGSSSTIRLLNVPYPNDEYELRYLGMGKQDMSEFCFFAFTYKMEEGQYAASLPTSFMYTVTGDGVASNGYKFNVAIKSGYEATEDFAVKVNGTVVATQPGEVTVESVTEDLFITVEGVDKIYNAETDYSVTIDLTDFEGTVDGTLFLNKRNAESCELKLTPGKKHTITVDVSELWQYFATIYSITPEAEGYEVVGYDVNGERHESDRGYFSYGCDYKDANPGKYVIKPIVEIPEEKETNLFTVTANGKTLTPENIAKGECEQAGYEVDTYFLTLPAGTTTFTLTDENGLAVYETCNGMSDLGGYETTCEITVSEDVEYYCIWNGADGDDYYEVHLIVEVENGSTEPEVEPNPIKDMTVSHPTMETVSKGVYKMDIVAGVSEPLKLNITGENEDKEATGQISWNSTNEAVAKVVDGVLVTGPVTETTTVTLTAIAVEETALMMLDGEGSNALATIQVTVEPVDNTIFNVTMDTDKSVDAQKSFDVVVTISHAEEAQQAKSYEMIFAYDPDLLTLNTQSSSTDDEKINIDAQDGVITVLRFGKETSALTLNFTAKTGNDASVVLTSAKVGTSETAISENIPDAQVIDNTTLVTVNAYGVELDERFSGANFAIPGQDYTFSAVNKNYIYTAKVTVTKADGTTGEYTLEGTDGEFTLDSSKIEGQIKIEVATEVGKEVNVVVAGKGKDLLDASDKAQYMVNYEATLNPVEGTTAADYTVTYKVGANGEEKALTPTDNKFIIEGQFITDDITITVTPPEGFDTWNVTFEGNGKDDVADGTPDKVTRGEDFTFQIDEDEDYSYYISYKMGDKEGELTADDEGNYKVEKVSANLVITVMKWQAEVDKYIDLDGKTLFLVTVNADENVGMTYDGNAMFVKQVKTRDAEGKATGELVSKYSYLVEVAAGQSITVEEATKKLAIVDNVTCQTIGTDCNVNGSSALDINDAQLVYDLYNNVYQNIDTVGMQKFLHADLNGDRTINVSDAAAVVNAIINPTA